jgi:hypothetical protein
MAFRVVRGVRRISGLPGDGPSADLLHLVKPFLGHVIGGGLMFAVGGLVMSRNFTVQRGDFRFSTDDDTHSMARLQKQYSDRVKHMKAHSGRALQDLESDYLTPAAKRSTTKEVIDRYLSPTSHDKLYGSDIVIYNGKGKPTILVRDDWDEIANNWRRALVIAGVKDCVDTHRIGSEYSAHHYPAVTDAWKCCSEKCVWPERSSAPTSAVESNSSRH